MRSASEAPGTSRKSLWQFRVVSTVVATIRGTARHRPYDSGVSGIDLRSGKKLPGSKLPTMFNGKQFKDATDYIVAGVAQSLCCHDISKTARS